MEILTVEEVAAMLKVTRSWVYARTRDGRLAGTGRGRKSHSRKRSEPSEPLALAERIPHIKPGKLLRFERSEVLAWWFGGRRNAYEPSVTATDGFPHDTDNKDVNHAQQR